MASIDITTEIVGDPPTGVRVRFAYNEERVGRLKMAFPKARWCNQERPHWHVPGARAPQRVERWVDGEVSLIRDIELAEERARDGLAFDPFPPSNWAAPGPRGFEVRTPYSSALVFLFRNIGAQWDEAAKLWRLPFTAREKLEAKLPQIEELAAAAIQQRAEEDARRTAESKRREEERAERQRQREAEWAERDRKRQREEPPRPLRREFLVPRPGAPKFHFEIEEIGHPPRTARLFGGMPRRWFVAQIWASCPRYSFTRSFLQGIRDYSRANSRGTRGVYRMFLLEEGPIYEYEAPITWSKNERTFIRIWDGQKVEMTEEEVRACLER